MAAPTGGQRPLPPPQQPTPGGRPGAQPPTGGQAPMPQPQHGGAQRPAPNGGPQQRPAGPPPQPQPPTGAQQPLSRPSGPSSGPSSPPPQGAPRAPSPNPPGPRQAQRPALPPAPEGAPQRPGPAGPPPAPGGLAPQQPPQAQALRALPPAPGTTPPPNPPTGGHPAMGRPTGGQQPLNVPTGGQRPMGGQEPPPGSPTGGQRSMGDAHQPPVGDAPHRPLQGRVLQPGASTPEAEPVADDPVFPADAGAATQSISAVVDDNATQAIPPVQDDFGGLPMFRDETRRSGATYERTAEIDLSAMDIDGEEPAGRDRGRRRSGSGSGSGKKGILLGAGFAVLLLLGGGGAFLIASGGGSADPETGSGGGAVATPDAPVDLEPGAIFPDEVEVGGVTFTRVITDDTGEDCATAAHGDYGDVLTENDCRQLIRATYVSKEGDRAVTTGVAALPAPDKADAVRQAQDLDSADWFAGLKGNDGGAERMGFAGGHASGAQWGPYLVFALAANSDGRAPEAADSDLAGLSDGFTGESLSSLSANVG
ncbi:hypothetical protein HNR23_000012 [Nocardiopsis mwathae]|uniref:Uncharacterized protein n=1 Tax=Nocardiopsis mwathae TaxID=1472723 RepID=A0A7X0D3A2_9ACTN|nr:hypothetical protein [Nocardiopsis mwathae]MBB6169952.1 hypothetical protein [Nocardiopsis mwathae]